MDGVTPRNETLRPPTWDRILRHSKEIEPAHRGSRGSWGRGRTRPPSVVSVTPDARDSNARDDAPVGTIDDVDDDAYGNLALRFPGMRIDKGTGAGTRTMSSFLELGAGISKEEFPEMHKKSLGPEDFPEAPLDSSTSGASAEGQMNIRLTAEMEAMRTLSASQLRPFPVEVMSGSDVEEDRCDFPGRKMRGKMESMQMLRDSRSGSRNLLAKIDSGRSLAAKGLLSRMDSVNSPNGPLARKGPADEGSAATDAATAKVIREGQSRDSKPLSNKVAPALSLSSSARSDNSFPARGLLAKIDSGRSIAAKRLLAKMDSAGSLTEVRGAAPINGSNTEGRVRSPVRSLRAKMDGGARRVPCQLNGSNHDHDHDHDDFCSSDDSSAERDPRWERRADQRPPRTSSAESNDSFLARGLLAKIGSGRSIAAKGLLSNVDSSEREGGSNAASDGVGQGRRSNTKSAGSFPAQGLPATIDSGRSIAAKSLHAKEDSSRSLDSFPALELMAKTGSRSVLRDSSKARSLLAKMELSQSLRESRLLTLEAYTEGVSSSDDDDDALSQRGLSRLALLRRSQLDPFLTELRPGRGVRKVNGRDDDGDDDESYWSSTYCGSHPSNVTDEDSDLGKASIVKGEASDLNENEIDREVGCSNKKAVITMREVNLFCNDNCDSDKDGGHDFAPSKQIQETLIGIPMIVTTNINPRTLIELDKSNYSSGTSGAETARMRNSLLPEPAHDSGESDEVDVCSVSTTFSSDEEDSSEDGDSISLSDIRNIDDDSSSDDDGDSSDDDDSSSDDGSGSASCSDSKISSNQSLQLLHIEEGDDIEDCSKESKDAAGGDRDSAAQRTCSAKENKSEGKANSSPKKLLRRLSSKKKSKNEASKDSTEHINAGCRRSKRMRQRRRTVAFKEVLHEDICEATEAGLQIPETEEETPKISHRPGRSLKKRRSSRRSKKGLPEETKHAKADRDHGKKNGRQFTRKESRLRVSKQPGFRPTNIMSHWILQKQTSRKFKLATENAEQAEKMAPDIAAIADRPSLPTKSSSPSKPHSQKRLRGTLNPRPISRKDKSARERAMRRKEREYSGGGKTLPAISKKNLHDSIKTELSESAAAELSDIVATKWSEDQRREVESHRQRNVPSRRTSAPSNVSSRRANAPKDVPSRRASAPSNVLPGKASVSSTVSSRRASAPSNVLSRRVGVSENISPLSSRSSSSYHQHPTKIRELPRSRMHPHQREHINNNTTYNNDRGGNSARQKQHPVPWDDLDYAIKSGINNSLREKNSQEREADNSPCRHRSAGSVEISSNHSQQRRSDTFGGYNGAGGRGAPVSWDDLEDAIQVGLKGSLMDLRHSVVRNQEWRRDDAVPQRRGSDVRHDSNDKPPH